MGKRFVVDPWRDEARPREISINIRTEMPIAVDWSKVVTDRSGVTDVSSVAWTSVGRLTLTVASAALASKIATCLVSSSYPGAGVLRCEATFDDGNTESLYIHVDVRSPERR